MVVVVLLLMMMTAIMKMPVTMTTKMTLVSLYVLTTDCSETRCANPRAWPYGWEFVTTQAGMWCR